jgi:hypothetical protein
MKEQSSTNPYIPPYISQLQAEKLEQERSKELDLNIIKYLLAYVLVYQFGFFNSVFIFLGALALACFFRKEKLF